jgi:hypothetical protein
MHGENPALHHPSRGDLMARLAVGKKPRPRITSNGRRSVSRPVVNHKPTDGAPVFSFTPFHQRHSAPDDAELRKPTDEKRMVVILPPERYQDWLAAKASDKDFMLPLKLPPCNHQRQRQRAPPESSFE